MYSHDFIDENKIKYDIFKLANIIMAKTAIEFLSFLLFFISDFKIMRFKKKFEILNFATIYIRNNITLIEL